MNPNNFSKIAESMRQYRRAELLDFDSVANGSAIDSLYVDPLDSDAVLNTVLQNNTTFIIGRKGTGKSTVFAKAQLELRRRADAISVYIDVKSLHELMSMQDVPVQAMGDLGISEATLGAHFLRKNFLGAVIGSLVEEIGKAYEARSLIKKWVGKARNYRDVIGKLEEITGRVGRSQLTQQEIPILRTIANKTKSGLVKTESVSGDLGANSSISLNSSVGISGSIRSFDETVADNEVYQEYADAVLRSFPFHDLLSEIKQLLAGVGFKRLFVFFDDFSELAWVDQKLFVDVILSPLNNASEEVVKLKVAGYPGRVYYGKIDPGKIDVIGLDFYQLYKAQEIQASEASAVSYLKRLLEKRFKFFGEDVSSYFDSSQSMDDYFRLLFEATLNVPRLIGYVLHNCYLDRISKGYVINSNSIRLAAQKYYDSVVVAYFQRMNRFAMEPFERKLDRHNQEQLLRSLVAEARSVRKGISTGSIGGEYFKGLSNPPASHFFVSSEMEKILASLELNFLVTKYHEMRDKDGRDVSVYAFFFGLCESERFPWGYPKGRRDDRSYFVQRCFNYNSVIQQFLSTKQTITCEECFACFGMEKREFIEFYKWKCPECGLGQCKVVSLGGDFENEVRALANDMKLPAVELAILEVLNSEMLPMRAGDIAALIDETHQLVGHRTSKLKGMGLVSKKSIEGVSRSEITAKAKACYFSSPIN